MEHQSLVQLNKASQMLAKINSIDDAKQIVDLAEAARVYARQVDLGLEAQNHAAEVKIRAQRRGGEILLQIERSNGGRPAKNSVQAAPSFTAKLEELEIEETAAKRWQNIAKIPEEKFEEFIADTKEAGGEITTTAALKVASGQPHVAHNSGENEWYTPVEYVNAARSVLGTIDLDPASSASANKVVQADAFYTAGNDGLVKEWAGRVWMNPPYESKLISKFTSKLTHHYIRDDIKEAIVLVNNATDTSWFQDMAVHAAAICLVRGRIRFWGPNGEKGAPLQGQAVLYFGDNRKSFQLHFQLFGLVLWQSV